MVVYSVWPVDIKAVNKLDLNLNLCTFTDLNVYMLLYIFMESLHNHLHVQFLQKIMNKCNTFQKQSPQLT